VSGEFSMDLRDCGIGGFVGALTLLVRPSYEVIEIIFVHRDNLQLSFPQLQGFCSTAQHISIIWIKVRQPPLRMVAKADR